MSDTETLPPTAASTAHRRRRIRATAVGIAILAPAVIWLVAKAAGADLIVDMRNGRPPMAVGLPIVLSFSAQAAILGWIALALLEHFTKRARLIWTVLAGVVLLFSFVPIAAVGAGTGTKTALALMHLTVAGALIPLVRGDNRPRRPTAQ